jgi:catechol 2,3-dioxygenase-like lactoylglutathione lyase family enzyme
MTGSSSIIAFIPTRDADRAKAFYEGILGLHFVRDDHFALVFKANGITIRIVKMDEFVPAAYTILGWEVADAPEAAKELCAKGITFERYPGMEQDDLGIWISPNGSKVVWFKDPDGNVLSISQS